MEFLNFAAKIFAVQILLIPQKCKMKNLHSQRALFFSLEYDFQDKSDASALQIDANELDNIQVLNIYRGCISVKYRG